MKEQSTERLIGSRPWWAEVAGFAERHGETRSRGLPEAVKALLGAGALRRAECPALLDDTGHRVVVRAP